MKVWVFENFLGSVVLVAAPDDAHMSEIRAMASPRNRVWKAITELPVTYTGKSGIIYKSGE